MVRTACLTLGHAAQQPGSRRHLRVAPFCICVCCGISRLRRQSAFAPRPSVAAVDHRGGRRATSQRRCGCSVTVQSSSRAGQADRSSGPMGVAQRCRRNAPGLPAYNDPGVRVPCETERNVRPPRDATPCTPRTPRSSTASGVATPSESVAGRNEAGDPARSGRSGWTAGRGRTPRPAAAGQRRRGPARGTSSAAAPCPRRWRPGAGSGRGARSGSRACRSGRARAAGHRAGRSRSPGRSPRRGGRAPTTRVRRRAPAAARHRSVSSSTCW